MQSDKSQHELEDSRIDYERACRAPIVQAATANGRWQTYVFSHQPFVPQFAHFDCVKIINPFFGISAFSEQI